MRTLAICIVLVMTALSGGLFAAVPSGPVREGDSVAASSVPDDAPSLFLDVDSEQNWIELAGHSACAVGEDCCLPCDQWDQQFSCFNCLSDDFWTRQTLTDGLWGAQPALAGHGIAYQAYLTQFYQGVTSGGNRRDFKYGGKVDQFINLNSGQMGLWEGTLVTLHAETRYGETVIADAAGLAPVNANMLFPGLYDTTSITGLTISQMLSEEWMVSLGTFNQLDLFTQIYPQIGRGVDGFMNISSLIPLSVARPLNLSMLGASVTKLHEGQVQGSVAVFNTANSTTTSGFDKFFVNGAVVLGYWRLFTNFGDLPGSHAILGVYSSGTYTNVDPLSWAILPDTTIIPGSKTGTWNLTYLYERKLWIDPCNSQRNLGLFTSWGISDGNPNPIRWAGNVTFQGQGLIESRPGDSQGVGYFYTGLSSEFKDLASFVSPVDSVQGVEIFYNAAVTPWFHLTTDLQIVQPALVSQDPALVVGLRGKINL